MVTVILGHPECDLLQAVLCQLGGEVVNFVALNDLSDGVDVQVLKSYMSPLDVRTS